MTVMKIFLSNTLSLFLPGCVYGIASNLVCSHVRINMKFIISLLIDAFILGLVTFIIGGLLYTIFGQYQISALICGELALLWYVFFGEFLLIRYLDQFKTCIMTWIYGPNTLLPLKITQPTNYQKTVLLDSTNPNLLDARALVYIYNPVTDEFELKKHSNQFVPEKQDIIEPKTEIKQTGKLETKMEPKTEKLETKTETKTETEQTEKQTEKLETKTEHKTETEQTEKQTETQTEKQTETQTEKQTETQTEKHDKPEPAPEPKIERSVETIEPQLEMNPEPTITEPIVLEPSKVDGSRRSKKHKPVV